MGAICLIDTSIFLEILNVPHKASQSELILQETCVRYFVPFFITVTPIHNFG